MCLGIPARIIEINETHARVLIGSVEYNANIALLDGVAIGDYIILHAGFAIEKVDPAEAAETIRLIGEISSSEEGRDHD